MPLIPTVKSIVGRQHGPHGSIQLRVFDTGLFGDPAGVFLRLLRTHGIRQFEQHRSDGYTPQHFHFHAGGFQCGLPYKRSLRGLHGLLVHGIGRRNRTAQWFDDQTGDLLILVLTGPDTTIRRHDGMGARAYQDSA